MSTPVYACSISIARTKTSLEWSLQETHGIAPHGGLGALRRIVEMMGALLNPRGAECVGLYRSAGSVHRG